MVYTNGAQTRVLLYVQYPAGTASVTVTEALILRSLLADRGRITESIRILVPVDRMEVKCSDETAHYKCK